MKYNKIHGTDLNVSKICMGSMTWGEQNTEAEGHEQLDYAIEQGINFVDTAMSLRSQLLVMIAEESMVTTVRSSNTTDKRDESDSTRSCARSQEKE